MLKNKKLLIIDLDGTVLQNKYSFQPQTLKALLKAKKAGHIICISTGRAPRNTIKFYNQLGLNTVMSNYNGAYISHPKNDKFKIISTTIKKNVILNLLAKKNIHSHISDILCEYKDNHIATSQGDFVKLWAHNSNKQNIVSAFKDAVVGNPNAVIIFLKTHLGFEVIREFCEANSNKISYHYWSVRPKKQNVMELCPQNSNKGTALKFIMNYYNFNKKNTYTFGDSWNDIEMQIYSKNAITVANGCDEVKEVSNIVLNKTNEEDGIAQFIYKNILNDNDI